MSRKDQGDKVIVFERAGVVFCFNFHPTKSFTDYKIGVHEPGKYPLTNETRVSNVWPSAGRVGRFKSG